MIPVLYILQLVKGTSWNEVKLNSEKIKHVALIYAWLNASVS